MSETVNIDQLLRRAHHLITEGREEDAFGILEKLQPETSAQTFELTYLRAWYFTLHGLWDDAAQLLLASDFVKEFVEEKFETIQDLGQTERRRKAHYLLMMGKIAINLGLYDEAISHYTLCIKFLDERRMNDVNVRIKARSALGMAYTQTGFFTVALDHYTGALELTKEDPIHPDLPDIYYGLCETYRALKEYPQALDYGQKPLQLYVDRSEEQLEGRIRNQLGSISYDQGDYATASNYYTRALSIALKVNSARFTLSNFTALADTRLAQAAQDESHRSIWLEEAWHYCKSGREYVEPVRSSLTGGMFFIICGKVLLARAQQAQGEEARTLFDESIHWYQQAIDI